jgi:hypothetical protein
LPWLSAALGLLMELRFVTAMPVSSKILLAIDTQIFFELSFAFETSWHCDLGLWVLRETTISMFSAESPIGWKVWWSGTSDVVVKHEFLQH